MSVLILPRWAFSIISFSLASMLSASLWAANAVPTKAEDTCPIQVGEILPDISLTTADGKTASLRSEIKKKPTILIFYRGSWCPYCNTHLGELQTIEKELLDLGYQVVAISPDRPENLKGSVSQHKLNYTLLSDSKAEAAKALGLAFRVDDATHAKYLNYNIDLEKASGEKHHILPIPAAIVLNQKGETQFVFTSPNYKIRVDTTVLLAAAKSALKK